MFLDALTVWFRNSAPAEVQVVAAATTQRVVLGSVGDCVDVLVVEGRLTGDTPFSAGRVVTICEPGHERIHSVATTEGPDALVDAIRAAMMHPVSYWGSEQPVVPSGRHRVRLTDKQRRVLELYVDGWSRVRIAEELGISAYTVADSIKVARKKFRAAGLTVDTKIQLRVAAQVI